MKDLLYSLLLACVAAITLSGVQFLLAIKFSQKILWQVYIMLLFVGPYPILGYDSGGKRIHEGTPLHMVAAYFGLLFGVIVYTVMLYFLIIRMRHNKGGKAIGW